MLPVFTFAISFSSKMSVSCQKESWLFARPQVFLRTEPAWMMTKGSTSSREKPSSTSSTVCTMTRSISGLPEGKGVWTAPSCSTRDSGLASSPAPVAICVPTDIFSALDLSMRMPELLPFFSAPSVGVAGGEGRAAWPPSSGRLSCSRSARKAAMFCSSAAGSRVVALMNASLSSSERKRTPSSAAAASSCRSSSASSSSGPTSVRLRSSSSKVAHSSSTCTTWLSSSPFAWGAETAT
mmetsp:Transcript_4300/g.15138  ORF Transcript_4300/g.15138 Transcript_4300/m.15138 type:complete len:238 (+) Transcript_4300:1715-2428(+)